MAFKEFTQERWQKYQSTIYLREPPHPIDWARARLRIEQVIRTYSEVEEQREMRRLSVAYLHDLQEGRRLVNTLRDQLIELKCASPSAITLSEPPSMHELDAYLDYLAEDQTRWHVADGGTKRRSYETLLNGLLFIWEDAFHGRLRYSKGASPTPDSPLIRFLHLALVDAMGERSAPRAHGIRSIIERAKKRRLRRPSKTAR